MKRLIVCGINCSHMEDINVAIQQYPASCHVGRFLRKEMAEMAEANRAYLNKRSTGRLLQLFGQTVWKAPCRSALIFEVINRRALAARAEFVGSNCGPIRLMKGGEA